jgi:Domain of unknown function (DUF1905)/Bacteriocin-protection, YdeI or OmpD-Associated
MTEFKAILQRFGEMGEKTGWTYLEIPPEIAQQIKPNTRTSYRVKGKIDDFPLKMVALLPMGEGAFIIPMNNAIRKGIRKEAGATVHLTLEEDTDEFVISPDLMMCMEDETIALENFNKLPKSHQKYYSKWIESAKTMETKSKRISMTIKGFEMGMNYGEMMRYYRDFREF